MKISASQINIELKNPNPLYIAWLVYGPDEGKVRDYAIALKKSVLQEDTDPLRFMDFLGDDIKSDPSKFFNETGSISMFGGRSVLRIRSAKDGITSILHDYINAPNGDGLIIVEAGDLKPSSSLRKLFDQGKNVASIPCYLDEARDIARMAQMIIQQHGLTIEPYAMKELLARLGSDHALSRNEIEKLCLYKGEGQITYDDVDLLLGDSHQVSIQAIIMATASGQIDQIEREIEPLWSGEISPIGLLRATTAYFMRLQESTLLIKNGLTSKAAVDQLKPPLFFKVKPLFIKQLGQWPLERIIRALDLLAEAEAYCKISGNLSNIFVHRTLIRIASAAARSTSRS